MKETNPEVDQDRTADLVETFRRHGVIMFRQQRAIYRQLAERLARKTVLEAGCGLGTGAAMIHAEQLLSDAIVATDKLDVNVRFARETYPWIRFETWDCTQPSYMHAQSVVAVEMLEHVADPVAVLKNLWASTEEELWVSTPNGAGKPRPPLNPFHVREYSPAEVFNLLEVAGVKDLDKVAVFGWEDFSPQGIDTTVDPLVYWVKR